MPEVTLDIEIIHILQDKEAKYDKLRNKVMAHYDEGSDSNLCDIGETVAEFFGMI